MSAPLSARVKVPATSANLGAGFDCVGMAVDRWLSASVTARDEAGPHTHRSAPTMEAITVSRGGTLASLGVAPADDAIVRGFIAGCDARDRAIPARLDFIVESDIPFARGLGSSSAALVAGVRLANESLQLGLSLTEIAAVCAGVEGHPDNVAPAVFGGLVLAVPDDHAQPGWIFASLPVHEDLAFVFIVPPFLVETAHARAVLPTDVRHRIAVSAAAKAAALVHGLASADGALLRVALNDVLHVPYRRGLIPALTKVHDAACAAGAYGATLSGSGSTLVAVVPHRAADRVALAMKEAWSGQGVAADTFVQRRPATAQTLEK